MKLQYAKIIKRGGPRPFHVYGGHNQRDEVWSFRGAYESEGIAKALVVEINDAGT